MIRLFLFIFFGITSIAITGCKKTSASQIIDDAIIAHGGEAYDHLDISFDFRNIDYKLQNDKDKFTYSSIYTDSSGNVIQDIINNDGFTRTQNDTTITLPAKEQLQAREKLNSVMYFVLLPYKLNDKAVVPTYLGQIEIRGILYDKVEVRFRQEGGGKDYGDVFCYWFDAATHTLEYLSYANGGPRFRKVKKRYKVQGVIFQDYYNYVVNDSTIATSNYDSAFIKGNVKLLSIIEQKDYKENSSAK